MKVLAIVGMHRSGTSLVAHACAAAGINAGPEKELLSAQADNPEGFYENQRLVELNDVLIAKEHGAWYSPPLEFSASTEDERLAELLMHLSDSSTHAQYLLKDPRLCLTWQLWEPLIDNPTVLFVYRSPLAVARSLARRNSFPLQFGLALWEIYNRRALALLDSGSLSVSYDQLAAGASSLVELMERLGAKGFVCTPESARSVYRAELRHFDAVSDDPDWELLSASQKALHEHCTGICSGGQAKALPELDPESLVIARTQDLASALEPLARLVEATNERDEAQALALERLGDRDRALAALKQLEGEYDSLVNAHENEQIVHAKAAAALASLTQDHHKLALAHENEVSAHAHLLTLYESLHAEFTEKTEYLFALVTESHRTLLSFELSTMARLQRYTRKLYRFVTGRRGKNSDYDTLLKQAHIHFDEFGIEKPIPRPTKLGMARDVLRYVRQNPAGSARSFSLSRLRRASSVFFGSSSDDLAVWINARFPDAEASPAHFDPATLSADLDHLELDFPASESPVVSIVVPVYNDYRVTINCLESVHRLSQDVVYEVIIADDSSTDLTTTIAERMRGIKVSTTPENLRFLKNCNQAAAHARGEFVVFLNNDTVVTEGWLTALLEPFNDHQVGITGPKLLFADGALQEAGGIIWDDASGWNFGRADERDKPAYNYRRDVDYVSGACLAIRHDLWRELGGFDERFVPAYYEDADICFSARAAGYRVVYQPESVVYHFEGVSNGTDLNSGVKQHQVENQTVFRDKWQEELQARHFPNAEHVVHARDRSAGRPCVLVIDHYVPHHDKDAGGRSTYMYIQLLLALGCRVQVMGANFFAHQPYTKALQAMGVEVLVGESIARHLDQWLAEHAPYIDEVFLHRPHIAEQMLPHLERMSPRPPISFFGHDLHYLRIAREAALKDDDGLRRDSESWRKRELAVCERADRVYYFSEVEIDALSELVPAAKLRRIPLYTMQIDELPEYAPSAPTELLFVGGYNHPPNVDAALWLVNEILPRVLEAVPGAKLHLVGSNPPTDVSALASDVVQVHGYVSDEVLDTLYRRVGAVVVPLRYGAGIKGKIIEAIAHHVPVVTTDVGVEGIPDSDSVMWIENTAQNIAERLIALLIGQEPKDEKLDRHGAWLENYFDRDSAADVLRADIPRLGYPKDSK